MTQKQNDLVLTVSERMLNMDCEDERLSSQVSITDSDKSVNSDKGTCIDISRRPAKSDRKASITFGPNGNRVRPSALDSSGSFTMPFNRRTALIEKLFEHATCVAFCMAFGIGLGNIWRFPYVAYRNGGGSFVIAYSLMTALVGIPLFFLEFALGQFSSNGPAKCWGFCPIFAGVGLAMLALSIMLTVPYGMTNAIALHYLIFSFKYDLPWLTCDKSWATTSCVDGKFLRESCERVAVNFTGGEHIQCILAGPHEVSNHSEAERILGMNVILSAEEYFFRVVISSTEYGGDNHTVGMSRYLVLLLCYIGLWLMVWLLICTGLRTAGKMIYVTAFMPYLALVILFIVCISMKGATEGMKYFFTPVLDTLQSCNVWMDAAEQLFYSLTVSFGGIIALSSLSDYHFDCLRYTFVMTLTNFFSSLLVGLVIFSCIGVLADKGHIPSIADIGNRGPELIFIVLSMVLEFFPVRYLWGIIMFTTIIIVGMNNQLVLITTVTSAVLDYVPSVIKFKWLPPSVVCAVCCILGIPLVLEGGISLYKTVDTYIVAINAIVIAGFECVGIAWVYGSAKFLNDIETMIGENRYFCIPWFILRAWWRVCWNGFIPIILLIIFIVDFACTTGMEKRHPVLTELLREMSLVIILVSIAVYLIKASGSLRQRLVQGTTTSPAFEPVLPTHRASVMAHRTSGNGFQLQ